MAKRFSFNDMPIGRKLLVVCLAVTGVMLAALSGLSIVKEASDWRHRTLEVLSSNAKIISANTAPALLFSDRMAAVDTLSALKATPDVKFAAVYDAKGDRFAVYGVTDRGPERLEPPLPLHAEQQFTRENLILTQPITFRGEHVGAIYLKADLSALYSDVLIDSGLTLFASIAAFAFATVLFMGLQRSIVRPIVQLSGIMRGVSTSGGYAVRAPVVNRDEVGVLAESFNAMLQVIQDRDVELAAHRARLEEAVRQRTAELNQTNGRLENELTERKAAQEALHAHDAMLKAVAHSAADLLGALNIDDAVASVLELMGQTLAVARVQLSTIETDQNGRLRSSVKQEWAAPGLQSMIGEPALKDLDLAGQLPGMAAASLVGERTSLALHQVGAACRGAFEKAGMRSLLFIPVMAEGKFCGGLWFMDSSTEVREWSWAETDTLTTLAGLIGVSSIRARYVQELADANRIVQNSPTVLYRVKGEPTLPISYMSENSSKLGFRAKDVTTLEALIPKIVHPDDQAKTLAAAAAAIGKDAKDTMIEFRLVLPSGVVRWVENRWTPVRDELGRLVELEGIMVDITERKIAEEKIAQLARTDSLTGLANRATFVERLQQAFNSAKRSESPFAVLYLDLDHFKDINDTRGHPMGDKLLREVAERLKTRVRETDLIARLGGDEFAVLQLDIADPSDAGALASDIIQVLGAPYKIDSDVLHITASVGISPYSADAAGPEVILSQADLALYRAKEEGRNQFRFHTEDLDRQVSERVIITEELRQAIEKGELELYYQPQVELTSGRIIGIEALVRWNHPRRGLLKPADFIPVAEQTGEIRPLGRWVLEHACEQMRSWKDQGVAPQVMAVNVSMSELRTGTEFVRQVSGVLDRTGVKPQELEFDVTESMLAQATLAHNNVLEQLGNVGIQIALDDFGTDYSSFDYLRAYRVNHLKVARTFIEHATQDPAQAATVRAIIGVAKELGIQVIAEGVETQQQRSLLLAIGPATKGQGFFFSEAVQAERATELLQQGSIDRSTRGVSAA